jgi:type I restriction enzyme M protein
LTTPSFAYLSQNGAKHIAVYPALGKTRPAGQGHPEEEVRLNAYNELISKYGYPPELLDIECPVLIREDEQPRSADIVVFDDKGHKRPFIVVETKKPNRSDGERQGQRYATILRAVYVLWTNGGDRSCSVLVNRYPEEAVSIKDIPRFGGEPKYAIDRLEPFKDDRQVTTAFNKCHDLIWSLNNLKPDAAFTEFLKILLVKFEDETRESAYEFQILL